MEEEIKKAKRKYIKMFFEAQVMTQELKRGDDHLDKQGHVYLYPEVTLGINNLTPTQTLTYIKYKSEDEKEETFKKKLEANDPAIQRYFSINPEGQLVVATLVATTVSTSSKTEGHLFGSSNTTTTYEATEVIVDYKSMISQYATPMTFFLNLGITARNPEFLEEVVKLVKSKTNIQLTVLNTTTTEITTQVDSETEHIRGRVREDIVDETTGNVTGSYLRSYSSDVTTVTTTTTTVVTKVPSVKLTSADTWVCSQKITYSKIPGTPIEDEYNIAQESEPEQSVPAGEEGEVSWITREDSIVHTSDTKDTYDSGIASDYVDNTDDFIKLLDKEYKLPNSKEKRIPGPYIDKQWLFLLLSRNPETQGMEIVMRYIFNKYTKSNQYGNITLDDVTSLYVPNLVDVTTEDIIVDTTRSDKEIVIDDRKRLTEAIDASYSGQAKTNLINNVGAFLQMQSTYKVNAVFAIAVTIVESSGGTNWSAIAEETHNWMSVTGSYKGQAYKNPNSSNPRTWRSYPNYREAILDFGDLIANSSFYFGAGKYSVKEIAPTYCNDAWGTAVIAEMRKIYRSIGISIGGSSTEIGDGYSTVYTSGKTGKTYKEFKQNRGSYSTMIHGYSGGTIAEYGCNITSIAIVLSGHGHEVNPGTFANRSISTAGELKKYAKYVIEKK